MSRENVSFHPITLFTLKGRKTRIRKLDVCDWGHLCLGLWSRLTKIPPDQILPVTICTILSHVSKRLCQKAQICKPDPAAYAGVLS